MVDREGPLKQVHAPSLGGQIQAYQGIYRRVVPAHYRGNPLVRQQVVINILMIEAGRLVVPTTPQASFLDFYEELRRADPYLVGQIVSPAGTAKAAASSQLTPIKEITRRKLSGFSLPGDQELYGWSLLERDASRAGLRLEMMFQGNGLYFNRGSVFFDGQGLCDYPNSILADFLEGSETPEILDWIGVGEAQLKRPQLYFVTQADGRMNYYLHRFLPAETYRQGMERLRADFQDKGYKAGMAASPPLILPDDHHQPVYLSMAEVLGQFHANDIRHYIYCPFEGGILLSSELGRAQCLDPERLAGAIHGSGADRVRIRIAETLRMVSVEKLVDILENKGYAGRFSLEKGSDLSGREASFLSINPLEGIYSHLVVFLTRLGRFGIIQTSGTRGNVTGNDGPTLGQLSAILGDVNAQPLFEDDPILAAASGSQGNDVPNVVCRGMNGNPELLFKAWPQLALDDLNVDRGIVTTPRVGIGRIK